MNRLQKRCVVASAAFHGLLVVVLLFGAALTPKPEAGLNRFTLVTLATDSPSTENASVETVMQAEATPAPAPPNKPTLNRNELTMVSRNNPTPPKNPANDQRTRKVVADVLRNMTNAATTSGAVSISTSGNEGPMMANYGDLIYSRYKAAWIPPMGLDDESVSVTASVTISRDGQVVKHEIVKRSGNAAMDNSIETTLENVTTIDAFPAGAKDAQRTFTIKFTPGREQ